MQYAPRVLHFSVFHFLCVEDFCAVKLRYCVIERVIQQVYTYVRKVETHLPDSMWASFGVYNMKMNMKFAVGLLFLPLNMAKGP